MRFGHALEAQLEACGWPCIPFNSDQRVQVEGTGLYSYPDLSVACPPVLDAAREPSACSPTKGPEHSVRKSIARWHETRTD